MLLRERINDFSTCQFIDGKRAGPIATYYKSAVARENLTYKQYTTVLNVVRNGSQITGVKTNDTSLGPDGVIPLTSKGRVVLSTGAYGSPQLLFHSGIGPADMINLVKTNAAAGRSLPPQAQWIDLPVGYNVRAYKLRIFKSPHTPYRSLTILPSISSLVTLPSMVMVIGLGRHLALRTSTSTSRTSQVFLLIHRLGSTSGDPTWVAIRKRAG